MPVILQHNIIAEVNFNYNYYNKPKCSNCTRVQKRYPSSNFDQVENGYRYNVR